MYLLAFPAKKLEAKNGRKNGGGINTPQNTERSKGLHRHPQWMGRMHKHPSYGRLSLTLGSRLSRSRLTWLYVQTHTSTLVGRFLLI